VYRSPGNYSLTTNIERTQETWDGAVYCVSVPSSYLLVRRNGKVCVTGNCQNIPNPEKDKFKVRRAFIAPPGKVLIVGDYEQLEMRLLAVAANEQDMIDIFLRKWDIHMGNAALVFVAMYKKKHGIDLSYEMIEKAKGVEKAIKNGKMPAEALTRELELALHARSAAKTIGFG